MAASGIKEHHEACRKQNVINRQAYIKKNFMDHLSGPDQEVLEKVSRASNGQPGHLCAVNSYDVEKLHKQTSVDDTDRARRKAVRQEQYLTYSAKLNGRLSSQDYNQQW